MWVAAGLDRYIFILIITLLYFYMPSRTDTVWHTKTFDYPWARTIPKFLLCYCDISVMYLSKCPPGFVGIDCLSPRPVQPCLFMWPKSVLTWSRSVSQLITWLNNRSVLIWFQKREAQWPLWLPRKKYGKGYAYFRRYNTKVFGTLMNIIGGE